MRRGIELAAGPLGLFVVASALGSLALFAVATGLSLVYLGLNWAVTRAAQRVVVERTLDRREVLEGGAFKLTFEVQGLGRLPVGVERLCSCGKWHQLDSDAYAITWAIDHPGQYAIDSSALRLRDDLGLFTRPLTVGQREELLVLPAPAPTPRRVRVGAMDASHDPEPDGLRSYVPGTSMSRIHWPSVARGAELQERKFISALDHLPLVVVDTGGNPSGEAVDWAAREAAGHMLTLAREGGCRVLLPGDRAPTTLIDPVTQWPAVHRRLAALGRGAPNTGAVRDLRHAVQVRAVAAPADGLIRRGPLPAGVAAIGEWGL